MQSNDNICRAVVYYYGSQQRCTESATEQILFAVNLFKSSAKALIFERGKNGICAFSSAPVGFFLVVGAATAALMR